MSRETPDTPVTTKPHRRTPCHSRLDNFSDDDDGFSRGAAAGKENGEISVRRRPIRATPRATKVGNVSFIY